MKRTAFLILLLFCTMLNAIVVFPGSGEQVISSELREYTFAYHNGNDDFRFYGSDKWAVRFDFGAEYPSIPEVEFAIDKALLYFPQIGDSVRVELFNEVAGLPGQRLVLIAAPVTQNYLQIDFPGVIQAEIVWLIVTYSTNFVNRYVSASAGSGTRSYYLNSNVQHPYFQNFANAGFNCELLFGLSGDFVLGEPDLKLMDFDFTGNIAPREDVYPAFSIYNHSDQSISSARIDLLITSPLAEYSISDTIYIQETIAARSLYTYTSQSAGYFDHRLTLHSAPMQIKIRATLHSELSQTSTDPVFNNTIIKHKNSFAHSYPVFLAENFMRSSNAAQILAVQDQYNLPTLNVINYFPVLGDNFSNLAAAQRYHWYGFNSLPRTVLSGSLRITGYTTAYPAQYQSLAALAAQGRTFISGSECSFLVSSGEDYISATITLTNSDTHLFATTTDYNLLTNGRFFVALFKKVELGGSNRFTLERWVSHAEVINPTLNYNESFERSYNISLANIDISALATDYRLYYWFQINGGGSILFSDYEDFATLVSVEDEYISPPALQIYPNPMRDCGNVTIQIDEAKTLRDLSYSIYNLRGQKLFGEPMMGASQSIPSSLFPTSGIYLIRVEYSDARGKREINRKISMIK